MILKNSPLNPDEIFKVWHKEIANKNYGAFLTFTGIVREEDGISGLSFEIYEPILKLWFNSWEKKLNKHCGCVFFAHSIGDVLIHQCSYMAAVASVKRDIGLRYIYEFVEDFKANAPIWKYDIINGKKIYAKNRSKPIDGAGILGNKNDKL